MQSKVTYTTLRPAIGTIQAGESQQEQLDEFTERIGSGEFYRQTAGTIPCKCIDGRPCLEKHALQPNSAGGTETLMVADDLTTKRFAADGTTLGAYHAVLEHVAQNFPVGGHTADDLHGATSGCGANDKLREIYAFLATNGDTVREIATSVGVITDDETHSLIVKNAGARSEFSDGEALLAALQDKGNEESVDTLKGSHKEVVTVINTRTGTTLDREAAAIEFGEEYQAFNVDVWALEAGARAISVADDEIAPKVVAMVYYNIATAAVLAGPQMRIVVLN